MSKRLRRYTVLACCLAGMILAASTVGAGFAREIVVANSGRDEQLHGISYDCNRGQYLVVWHVDTGGGDTDIWGRRASARPFAWLGNAFPIAATAAPERAAAVVFNPTDRDYLVVFERQLTGGDIDITGQRVAGQFGEGDNGPDLKGVPIAVATTTQSETRPALAYLQATQQFLVVYERGGDVWARRVARYQWGDDGGQILGAAFPVAADAQWQETQPSVIASAQQSYFLVAYTYEFGVGDSDVRARRVRGNSAPSDQLLGAPFDIAFSNKAESLPQLAYSSARQTFLAVWQADSGNNSDVLGLWMDARNIGGNPSIGFPFELAADLAAIEGQPRPDIDPSSGDAVVVLRYASGAGLLPQVGQIWLNPDPVAANKIARPLSLFPARPFGFVQPRVALCHERPEMLIGYSARQTDTTRDAHLLTTSRWSLALPLIWR